MWELVRWLHLLGMAFFVGGQLFLGLVAVPGLRRASDPDALPTLARRFGWGTLAAGGVLLATGVALASHFHQWEDGTLQVKLALVAVVALLVAWHVQRPRAHVLDAAILLGSLAIVWLGVALAH